MAMVPFRDEETPFWQEGGKALIDIGEYKLALVNVRIGAP